MFLQTCIGVLLVFRTAVQAQTTPPPSPKPSQAAPSEEAFLKKEIEFMNRYRLMHAAAPLQLSLDLTNKAELWATKLASNDEEKIDVNSKYGQNIFSSKDTQDIARRSVQSWYNELRFYDFHSAKGSLKSAYFTQLVWVGSQEVGVGKAMGASGKTYIVALFNPPGNKGDYLRNVRPVTGSGVGKRGPSNCPTGYQLYNNVCYKYFPGPVNWVQAAEKCAERFSTLASIESQAEEFFIRTVLTSGGASDAWMGISDLNTVGVMSWLDGTENVYNNWDYYQTIFPGKKCGVISTNFNWKYKPCDKARGFVCKRPLRGLTMYMVLIRYEDKLWTDNLYMPGSPRHQALSRNIQEALLSVYGDFDWFEEVTLDHFSKGEQDKILAYIKLSFTPDDDSVTDPIQFLRDAIQGKGVNNSTKRSVISGTLHGEKVQLINTTLITADQIGTTCPAYCAVSQCSPVACSPWCCDTFGQQFFTQQQPQQLGYNSYGSQPYYNTANQMPAYPPQNQYPARPLNPYPVPQPAPYQYRVPPPPTPYQLPQQHQYVARPQPYFPAPMQLQQNPYQVPLRPQPVQQQVSSTPLRNSLRYIIMPKQQPQPPVPQPYLSIPRPTFASQVPVYTPPQSFPQMPIQAAPQYLQMSPNKKDKQGGTVQLQGTVFSYPYAPQPAPAVQPMPVYMPTQYYQPTVQHVTKQANSKEKEDEKKKGASEKSPVKTSQVGVSPGVAPGYPHMGYLPQGYSPQGYAPQSYAPQGYVPQFPPPFYPNPVPPPQTTWRIKLYRPVVTVGHPQSPVPLFNPGYPLPSQPFPPMTRQQYPPPQPSVTQPASPGLRPIEQRPQLPQPIPPPSFFPSQPLNVYRPPPVVYPNAGYTPGQSSQVNLWQALQKTFQPSSCPAPCPSYCAPSCTPMCCKDRK